MKTQEVYVDRDGTKHIEVVLEPNLPPFKQKAEINRLYAEHNLCRILDVDQREDADGFEFWHIKGV